MARTDWLSRRNRGIHMTIRDIDCHDFDVEQFVRDMRDMHVTFFSFFVAGYVTTYPSDLEYQRQSPYLGGRDLTGEIVKAARAAGIRTLAMIDLGQVPEKAARDHPDWCAHDAGGQPVPAAPGLYVACPMGGYQNSYIRDILQEVIDRFRVDCIKFGGASYGFPRNICYCPSCRASFRKATGQTLPPAKDWQDPLYRQYVTWRLDRTRHRAQALSDLVIDLDPDMPVMGNGVCFGHPDWTIGASLDIEHIAAVEDAVQVEVQDRARFHEAENRSEWQYLSWPAETARYMTSVSSKPIWVVASYFLAWPWRRNAVPPVEQKVYLAQIAANGADPMVNLSGGPPAVHEDQRGFQAIRELYGFLAKNRAYYQGDESAANVAIVYSLPTLFFYGRDDPKGRYVQTIRGVEAALHRAHIPFDIISNRVLTDDVLARYKVVILPNLACMSEPEAAALQRYTANGGGLVASFETSLYDHQGQMRGNFLLADYFGANYSGQTKPATGEPTGAMTQAYMAITPDFRDHPLLAEMAGTSLLPIAGPYCAVHPIFDAEQAGPAVPLTRSAPFIVFPEGFSYPDPAQPPPGDPLALLTERPGGGRVVYFPGRVDNLYWQVPYPDLAQLMVNAVRWAGHDSLPLQVDGPPTLQVSLRRNRNLRLVHLINLTGGERFFTELIPLQGIQVRLPLEAEWDLRQAFLLSNGQSLPTQRVGRFWQVTVPQLTDYDVLVFELM